jgi:lysophospholipase L1-like esterase
MRRAGIPHQRTLLAFALAMAGVLAVTACSGTPGGPSGARLQPAPATYYLALGDSLSQGVQPNASGTSVETRAGYPDQVYAALRPSHPTLELVKLGCPGETTKTMIHGGICSYRGGSQLAAAVAFLHAHRGRVFLVTIDIGANDPESCGAEAGLGKLASCFGTGIPGAATNLAAIIAGLKAVAGPGVRIVGMNYYLPALAQWHHGLPGQAIAWVTEKLAATYNDVLNHVYAKAGLRVANVFDAFDTANFGDRQDNVPRNVTLLCQWTWACAAPPRGPNQHANQTGYQVIARTVLQAADLG